MSSRIAPILFPLGLAAALAACSKPEPAPSPAAQSESAPSATAEPAPEPAPSSSGLPALRALDETQRAEVVAASSACNLEAADDQAFAGADVTLSNPSSARVSGWLKAGGATIENPVLRIETLDKTRIWDVPIQLSAAREDLPLDPAVPTPGFVLEFDASALAAGRYHLYLAYRSGGVLHGCDNGRHINLL